MFYTLTEATTLIENCRSHYNEVMPHSSLGYQPPAPKVSFHKLACKIRRHLFSASYAGKYASSNCNINKKTGPTLGFNNFYSAKETIQEIENINMLQKVQIIEQNALQASFNNFVNLMA